jgi:sugar lactone lactonase YvrE
MTSDLDGHLWMALWGGAGLAVWDPEKGTLLEKIELPAKNVTSCVFGGSELDELFITTARKGLETSELNAYPSSGGLFRLQTDVRGMPTFAFDDLT